MSGDFYDINRSVHYLLKEFQERITKANSTFFNEVENSLKKEFLDQLDSIVKTVNEYQTKDFSIVEEQETPQEMTVKDGLNIVWKAFRRKWKRKK